MHMPVSSIEGPHKAIVKVREPVQQSDDHSLGQVEVTPVDKSTSRAGEYIHLYSKLLAVLTRRSHHDGIHSWLA